MNATKTTLRQQFGIGTRTKIRIDEHRLLTLTVRAGDLLRSDGGTVWATVDGELDDIRLGPGDVHAIPRDGEVRVSAFGHAGLVIYGHGPLQYEVPQLGPARGVAPLVWSAAVSAVRGAISSARALALSA